MFLQTPVVMDSNYVQVLIFWKRRNYSSVENIPFSLHMNHPLIITVAYFGSMGKSKIHVSKGLLESIQAFISGLNPQCNCKMEIKRKRLMVGKIP